MHHTDILTADVTTATAAFDGHPANAAGARDIARAFLESLDRTIDPETIDTVLLVVSELATNALRHARGGFLLDLTAHRETLDVAVTDSSPAPPHRRSHLWPSATGGFGWPMVQHLALTTMVTPTAAGGKTVRARLPFRTSRHTVEDRG